MPDKHSTFSPSKAAMVINCPPSLRKNEELPDSTSDYAAQGTEAHAWAENRLLCTLGRPTKDPRPEMKFFDQEMADSADEYVSFVMEHMKQGSIVMVEQKLDLSAYVKDSFGTADCIVITGSELTIIDFKYGKGIPVSAGSDETGVNPQMACYALGALSAFDGIYDIDTVSMSIFQPRLSNVDTYTLSKDALLRWAAEVLMPAAQKAFDENNKDFQAGEHCRFCKFKNLCRKRAEYNLELARYDFAKPDELEDTEIEAILGKVDELISWASDIKDYALDAALSGKKWTDYKLVAGRSTRKYTNEGDVAEVVEAAGYDPYEKKVLGITAMSKLLGKQKFEEILGSFIEKPAGKPTLVSRSDKRKELITTAKEDFMEE